MHILLKMRILYKFAQTDEMRWYGFILDQTSKVSIMLEAASSVDADLYVFQLDQETYNLDLIGGSASTGLGTTEYYSTILGEGIYYFAIDDIQVVNLYILCNK